jgi:formate-dependent phosphoribosylglycinamide formyltransferase (GAR transformylase)
MGVALARAADVDSAVSMAKAVVDAIAVSIEP